MRSNGPLIQSVRLIRLRLGTRERSRAVEMWRDDVAGRLTRLQ